MATRAALSVPNATASRRQLMSEAAHAASPWTDSRRLQPEATSRRRSGLAFKHLRERVEELPHMLGGLEGMQHAVGHAAAPIGGKGFEQRMDVLP